MTCNRMGTDGDIKLYGHTLDVQEPDVRQAYRDALRARLDWAPKEPEFHAFSLDVEAAGYITFAEPRRVLAWDPERGLRELPFPESE